MLVKRKEYDALSKTIDRAVTDGSGSTIFVTGEPGIGKSTFIKNYLENIDGAEKKKILTGSGFCMDLDGVSKSYHPWKEALFEIDAAFASKGSKDVKKNISKIMRSVIDETGTEWMKVIPYVGEIGSALLKTAQTLNVKNQIDIDTGEVVSVSFKNRLKNIMSDCGSDWLVLLPVVGNIASALFKTSKVIFKDSEKINIKTQQDFFVQVMNRLRHLAKNNVIVLFFDDLQWADISTLNLFYYISLNLFNNPYPLVLIGTYRPQDVKEGRISAESPTHQRHPLEEKLNNLARYNAYEEIVMNRFSAEQTIEYLKERFPNNCFDNDFTRELHNLTNGNILFLAELLNYMEEAGNIYMNNSSYLNRENIIYSVLPGSIAGVIKERYDRIAENYKEFLRVASVIGNDFPAELLTMIMNENAIGMFNKIETLKNKYDIIANSQTIIEKFNKIYRFSHNLMQKYIYYSIDDEFRYEYHKLIFDEYDKYYKEESPPEVTPFYSYHYGIGNKIIDGNNNIIINNESIKNNKLKNAVTVFTGLQKKLSEYYETAFSYDEALASYNIIISLSKILQNSEDIAVFLLKKADILKLKGEWQEAESILNECISLSEINSFTILKAKGFNSLGRLYELNGNYDKAEEYILKSLTIFGEQKDAEGISEAAGNLSVVYKHKNEITKAKQFAEMQLKICNETNDKKGLAFAYGNLGYIHLASGELDKAENYYNEQLKIYTALDDKSGISYATGNIGTIYFEKYEYDEALKCYNNQLEICNELQDIRGIARTLGNIGTVYMEYNNIPQAMFHFGKQLSSARELGDKRGELYALLNMGIANMDSADNISEKYFSYALQLASELNDQKAIEICRKYFDGSN